MDSFSYDIHLTWHKQRKTQENSNYFSI